MDYSNSSAAVYKINGYIEKINAQLKSILTINCAYSGIVERMYVICS